MALSPSLTPARGMPFLSSLVFPKVAPTTKIASVGTGVVTLTPAELLSGLLLIDCQDAQTVTFPTATQLNGALPGVGIGTSFDVDIINYGDSLLTVALGTGMSKPTIAGVSGVLTLATLCTKRFMFVCTGVAQGTVADAWVVYAFGSTAAAVA